MTEAVPAAPAKLRKFPCAACGADVVWNPGAASLKCPYCGAERKLPQTLAEVREHPIEEALGGACDLGWGIARKAVSCRGCGATTTFEPGIAASRCAFCGAPAVVEAPANENMVRPEGLLPLCTATARSNLFHHPYECPNAPREIGTAVWLLDHDLRVTEVCRFLG